MLAGSTIECHGSGHEYGGCGSRIGKKIMNGGDDASRARRNSIADRTLS